MSFFKGVAILVTSFFTIAGIIFGGFYFVYWVNQPDPEILKRVRREIEGGEPLRPKSEAPDLIPHRTVERPWIPQKSIEPADK